LAGKAVKILAVYFSPSRSLIGADLTACFGVGLPVLIAGDLNAKRGMELPAGHETGENPT
jgi:hypothetical protein